MEIVETDSARKLDSNGRLVIPIKLREQLGLNNGEIYRFYIITEGKQRYLAISCPETDFQIDLAKQLLERNGMRIIPT